MRRTMSALRVTSFWRRASSTGLSARAWCPPSISTTSPGDDRVEKPSSPTPADGSPSGEQPCRRHQALPHDEAQDQHGGAVGGSPLGRANRSQLRPGPRDSGPDGRSETQTTPYPNPGDLVAAVPPREGDVDRVRCEPAQTGGLKGADPVEDGAGPRLPDGVPTACFVRHARGADDHRVETCGAPPAGGHLGTDIGSGHAAGAEILAVRDTIVIAGHLARDARTLGPWQASEGWSRHDPSLTERGAHRSGPVDKRSGAARGAIGRAPCSTVWSG